MDYYNDIPQLNQKNEDFYFDKNGNVVYTEKYLKERRYCCGNICKHCGYIPKNSKGSTKWKNYK